MRFAQEKSIDQKILIPSLIMIVLLAIISLLSYNVLKKQLFSLANSNNLLIEKSTLIDEVLIQSEQVRSDLIQISSIATGQTNRKETTQIHLKQGLSAINDLLGQIDQLSDLDKVEREKLDVMKKEFEEINRGLLTGDEAATNTLLVRIEEFIFTVQGLRDYQNALTVNIGTESIQRATKISTVVVSIGILVSIVGTLSTVMVGNLIISHPIKKTIDELQRLAHGELDIEIQYLDRKDEIGSMAKAIEVFCQKTNENVRLTEALKVSAERFRELFNNMSSGVVILQEIDNGSDFLIKDVNKSLEETSQVKKEDILENKVYEVFPGIRKTKFHQILEQVWLTGNPIRIPEFIYKDDRLNLCVDIYVYKLPSGELVVVVDNITEQRQVKQELADQQRMLSTLMSNLPGLAYRCLKDDDRTMVFASEGCTGLTGYPSTDLLQNKIPYSQIIHTEDLEYTRKRVKAGLESAGRFQLVYRIITAEGKEKWVWEQGAGFQAPDGTVFLEGFISDITERKLAEQALEDYSSRLEEMVNYRTRELERAQEQLVRSEKLAVMGQLAGGIAHELRNPLGAIKNISYYLNLALESPEPEVKEAIDALEHEVVSADNIINSLLNFARTKSVSKIELDTNAIVTEALYRVSPSDSQQIQVVSQLDGSLPPILGDYDQLVQLFCNLIQNAYQALEQPAAIFGKTNEGSLFIERNYKNDDGTENKQLIIKTFLDNNKEPGWICIAVTDTGVGIPSENLKKVFEPLFSTKAKGIGLGLALARILAEEHGGNIQVDSQVGKGSTFTVRLPIIKTFESLK